MNRETFHLAISYIDRYLSVTRDVRRTELQLLGTAALLVASKLEEIRPPHLDDFSFMCEHTLSNQEIAEFELIMCSVHHNTAIILLIVVEIEMGFG